MNAFPKLISAVPVSYGGADVLKVSVSFNYDRYVIGNNGFSKGFQGSFADPKQQSSELQQVKLNTLKSVTPPTATQTSTTQTSTTPTPPAISEDVQAGLKAAKTESSKTGYVDPNAGKGKAINVKKEKTFLENFGDTINTVTGQKLYNSLLK
jgi:hypothetical protein